MVTEVLGGHEHVYLYRKFGNSVLLKSGVNFKTYSELTLGFRESEEKLKIFEKKKNLFKLTNFLKKKLAKPVSDSSSSDGSKDSETDSENANYLENYKSTGDKTTSYKSDFYFNDSNFSTKMFHFPGHLQNTVKNQFAPRIELNVRRVDIDEKDFDKELLTEPSYLRLKEHVEHVLTELEEKGKEKMFFLLDDVDLTSHSVRTRENNMANWICRLVQIESGADIAICTGGSLRSMQKFDKDHVFTLMDLNKMTAIIDHFEFVSVPGKVFVQILENGYRGLPNALGSFMHFAGARVVINQSESYDEAEVLKREEKLFSKRIKCVGLDQEDFDPEKDIVLIGLHFMVEGKDGFSAFNKGRRLGVKDYNITKNDLLGRFFRITRDENVRKEFRVFKEFVAPHVHDSMIRVVQNRNDPFRINSSKTKIKLSKTRRYLDAKKKEYLTEELLDEYHLKENFVKEEFLDLLERLNLTALKRLRKYLIVHGIREVEGDWIFELSPKFFSRVIVE